MNFDFSAEQIEFGNTLQKYLHKHCELHTVSKTFNDPDPFPGSLWQGLTAIGVPAIAIPDDYLGAGAGYLELCIAAEQMGRALCPVPFLTSVVMATECIKATPHQHIKQTWLPRLACGESIATCCRLNGSPSVSLEAGLHGHVSAVPDASNADIFILAVGSKLLLVELDQPGVVTTPVPAIDRSRPLANIAFSGASYELLATGTEAETIIRFVQNCAAVICAFEQLGGAERALEKARDYALERRAFGRPIGSFQAIKHMLVDILVANELARSNCYWGAWALFVGSDQLTAAAAAARLSATAAFQLSAADSLQVHGGIGFTWESHCHLFYRRSNYLANVLGSTGYWENQLVDSLQETSAHSGDTHGL